MKKVALVIAALVAAGGVAAPTFRPTSAVVSTGRQIVDAPAHDQGLEAAADAAGRRWWAETVYWSHVEWRAAVAHGWQVAVAEAERQATVAAEAAQQSYRDIAVTPATPPSGGGGGAGGALASIRACESGGNYSTNTGNGYYGAYQFDQGTWESVGGTGNPAHASPGEQDARAQRLMNERGGSPWPNC